jgi:hypothetical protein
MWIVDEETVICSAADTRGGEADAVGWRMLLRRLRRRLLNVWSLLLDRNPDPKHRVAENIDLIHYGLWLLVALETAFVFWTFLWFGFLAALLAYAAVVLATVEVPHLLWDR